jgi:hypothetical protein
VLSLSQAKTNPPATTPKRIYRPNGLSEVYKIFGDIRAFIRVDGTIRPEWERTYLASARLPSRLPLSWDPVTKVSTIRCHVLLVRQFEGVFQAVHDAGFWPAVHDYGGCYNFRPQRGSSGRLSLHAWGIAVDLNTTTNMLGETGDMSPDVIRIFEEQGFVWGGNFSRPDGMHFQFADGY